MSFTSKSELCSRYIMDQAPQARLEAKLRDLRLKSARRLRGMHCGSLADVVKYYIAEREMVQVTCNSYGACVRFRTDFYL